ncbi:ATP-binding protein [Delftia sp. WSY_22]|uniref:BbrUII/HgiDII family restriction enzyme n=1 Tax=Delftia sp. WSY_22 TaxID=3367213 RepID=UPI00370CEA05
MKIDLRVLDHLGIKLYSNVAAVISEAVANAWDADAQNVRILISPNQIVIEDDGCGMDLTSVNKRFLAVGYDKRTSEGSASQKGRRFMGRKGIGKLSLFSIADSIDIHTQKNGEKHAFTMSVAGIQSAIAENITYKPEPIEFDGPAKGTKIIMTSLKKRGTSQTIGALRKRVARRFSIIGFKDVGGDSFDVEINGSPITHADREDLQNIEFLWQLQVDELKTAALTKIKHKEIIPGVISVEHPDWIVKGWLGAAAKPNDLKSEDSGSMNGIVVVAHGRLIQENILDKLGFHKIMGSYITGQVEADFLDLDDFPDIATSDRQRLIEDDPRYIALVAFLRRTLLSISEDWTILRNEARGKEVQEEIPALKGWVNRLPSGQRQAARSMLGVIQGAELEAEDDRKSLYKAGVLAFERLRLQEASHQLGNLHELTAAKLMPLLIDMESLEGSLYRDIVASRLEIIKNFTKLVDDNEKENLLRDYLFENMWLLDPGWERAAGSERMEQALRKEFGEATKSLTEEQSKGRVDIRYRTNAEQHILVELKRAGRVLTLGELIDQGSKYKQALDKCVREVKGISYTPNIAVVFVLGKPVAGNDAQSVNQTLQAINGRVVYYEQLIDSAKNAYARFLAESEKAGAIEELIAEISAPLSK